MRTLIFTLFFILSGILAAQETTTATAAANHEIGLRLTGLTNFGMIYKKQLAPLKYRRVRLASAGLGFRSLGTDRNETNFGVNVAIGTERRAQLGGNFFFHHGPEPFGGINWVRSAAGSSSLNTLSVNAGLGYVLGFQAVVSERITIGLETIPSVQLSYTAVTNSNGLFGFMAGFDANAVALTATYSFVR